MDLSKTLSKQFTIKDYNAQPKEVKIKLRRIVACRKLIEYLWAGDNEAFNALYFIIESYKQWEEMLVWLGRNKLTGKRLVEFFQNESVDGGGYHMGATHIISRLDGLKNTERIIKVDELL